MIPINNELTKKDYTVLMLCVVESLSQVNKASGELARSRGYDTLEEYANDPDIIKMEEDMKHKTLLLQKLSVKIKPKQSLKFIK